MKKIKTSSICPVCLKTVDAVKYEKDFSVYLERTCDKHGTFTTKIAKDAKRFFDKTYKSECKPFKPITKFKGQCGNDCGLCDKHEQHICTGLIEVTSSCNLKCPTCYFGEKQKEFLTIKDFKERIETLLHVENGTLDILQISGGECTIHPKFAKLLEAATKYNIRRILINTNGLEILNNKEVFDAINSHKDKIDVYLQFDSFNDDVYKDLRGRALLKEKLKIIEKLDKHDIKIHLAVTVYKNNLSEIPKIIEFACNTPNISGITFQRLTKVGSATNSKLESIFQEDILLNIAKSKLLKYEDIIPLPCSHENCTSLAFLLCTKDKVFSLSDYIDYKKVKPALQNKLAFDETLLDYLKDNVCSCFIGKVFGNKKALDVLKVFIEKKRSKVDDMKILRITVKNFMDTSNFDWQRARKCCVSVAVGNNRIIPFCVNNNLKGTLL